MYEHEIDIAPVPPERLVVPHRIIFLDIDGVLVNRESLREMEALDSEVHPDCVKALNEIVCRTGAKIVVSSSWRVAGEDEMRRILAAWGVKDCVLGVTPNLTNTIGALGAAVARGDEIQSWLDTHGHMVEQFVILDDNSDMKHLKHKLIQTSLEDGLTMADTEKAVDVLMGNCSRRCNTL